MPTVRSCQFCGKTFSATGNHRYCSKKCSKKANEKRISMWKASNPEHSKRANQNRLFKNPGAWVEKSRAERLAIIELLGGKCVVRSCEVSNPLWLHVDYIPTTRDGGYRHPRHIAFIRRNKELFRLLCANHHYELTMTGKIQGTRIKQ